MQKIDFDPLSGLFQVGGVTLSLLIAKATEKIRL